MIDGMNDGPVHAMNRPFFSLVGLVIVLVLVCCLIGIDSILELGSFVLTVFRLFQLTSSSLTFFEFGRRLSHLPRNWKKRKTIATQLSQYYWWRNLELGVFGLVILHSTFSLLSPKTSPFELSSNVRLYLVFHDEALALSRPLELSDLETWNPSQGSDHCPDL
jgi:hypothetical protein